MTWTCRPWYGLTATYPVNMVIMIDKSQPMKNKFGAHTRMYYGIQATKDVIDSLNPYDNVRTIEMALQWLILIRTSKYGMHKKRLRSYNYGTCTDEMSILAGPIPWVYPERHPI